MLKWKSWTRLVYTKKSMRNVFTECLWHTVASNKMLDNLGWKFTCPLCIKCIAFPCCVSVLHILQFHVYVFFLFTDVCRRAIAMHFIMIIFDGNALPNIRHFHSIFFSHLILLNQLYKNFWHHCWEHIPWNLTFLNMHTNLIRMGPSSFSISTRSVENVYELRNIINNATGNMNNATGNIDNATGNMDNATGNMNNATGNMNNATGNINNATGNMDNATGNINNATGNMDNATGNMDNATGNMDNATGNMNNATGNMNNATGNMDNATGNMNNATGNMDTDKLHTFDLNASRRTHYA